LLLVWAEHRDAPWATLLGFWGVPNLQVINRDVHVGKCAAEARFRSGSCSPDGGSLIRAALADLEKVDLET
jgi:hypothetical protein